MQRSHDHSEWPCDFGGEVTLLFGEEDRLAKPSYLLSGKSVAGGKEFELSTQTYKIPFLVSSTEVIIG